MQIRLQDFESSIQRHKLREAIKIANTKAAVVSDFLIRTVATFSIAYLLQKSKSSNSCSLPLIRMFAFFGQIQAVI